MIDRPIPAGTTHTDEILRERALDDLWSNSHDRMTTCETCGTGIRAAARGKRRYCRGCQPLAASMNQLRIGLKVLREYGLSTAEVEHAMDSLRAAQIANAGRFPEIPPSQRVRA